jgi:hypothetical protein
MDKRYGLVLDYIERASAVLSSIPEGPIELANILRHTSAIVRLKIDADSPERKVLRIDEYRSRVP